MKVLLVDIETAPNSGYFWGLWQQNIGINQIIDSSTVLCWSAKWYHDEEIQFCSSQKIGHKRMLSRIHKLLELADVVVTYNGQRFDVPILNKEFLLNGFKPPSPFKQVDLYKVAKSKFKFASNKLDFISKALGFKGKVRHKGFELWVECMGGDKDAWAQMEEYNVGDVVQLEKVYDRFLPWITNHPNYGAYDKPTENSLVCNNCGSFHIQWRGFVVAKTLKYRRAQCQDCGKWLRSNKAETPRGTEHLIGVA